MASTRSTQKGIRTSGRASFWTTSRPKEKPECLVPDCGRISFLRQIEGFTLQPDAINPGRSVLLYDRDLVRIDGAMPAQALIPQARRSAVPSAARRYRREDPF
jgi:hypothetical protein